MSRFKGYRTLLLNVVGALVLVLGGLTGTVTDPDTLRYIGVALVVLNTVMRIVTTTPVGQSSGGDV